MLMRREVECRSFAGAVTDDGNERLHSEYFTITFTLL